MYPDVFFLVVPLVYVALQFDSLNRFEGSWRRAALGPLVFMMAAFTLQVLTAPGFPDLAARLPMLAMITSCGYLTGLILVHDRALRQAIEVEALAEMERSGENVVALRDYR